MRAAFSSCSLVVSNCDGRSHPSRVDLHDRQYAPLDPSHKLARHGYHRRGLVLPFGAPTGAFDMPNRFLFTPDGKWLQSDGANPLDSWEYVFHDTIYEM